MSLMINALKKYRQESGLSQTQTVSDASLPAAPRKYKKVLIVSLLTIIVICLIVMTSFLILKHAIKKHISEEITSKVQNVQDNVDKKIQARAHDVALGQAGAREGVVRDLLQQKLQQKQAGSVGASTEGDVSAGNVTDNTTATDNNSAMDNTSAEDNSSTNDNASSSDVSTTTTQSTTRPVQSRFASRQQRENVSTDQSATETSTADTTNDASTSSYNAADATPGQGVEIKAVESDVGENNATYQQALKLMQNQQYNKALALLVENDELLFKTQGLSALLMARIYLATEDYVLAEEALDHALLLHPGAELELMELKAQVYFMQQRYSEALSILVQYTPSLADYPEYYALLANVYVQLDQPLNAISIFQQIVAQFSTSAEYWLGLAVAYQKAGDVDSAIVAYRRAAQLSQNDPQVTLFISQQLERLQQL